MLSGLKITSWLLVFWISVIYIENKAIDELQMRAPRQDEFIVVSP